MKLFYVDSTRCINFPTLRIRPAAIGWTMELLRQREEAEVEAGGIGMVDIQLLCIEQQQQDPILSLEAPTSMKEGQDGGEGTSRSATVEVILVIVLLLIYAFVYDFLVFACLCSNIYVVICINAHMYGKFV